MLRSSLLLLLTTPLLGQGSVTSPAYYAAFEGNAATSYPFTLQQQRFQQAHGDLRGAARAFRSLSFRRDGVALAPTLGVARTLDMEAWGAHTDLLTFSTTFQSNYAAPAAVILSRRQVSLPDRTPPPDRRPMPWDVTITFDQPYAYDGLRDFLWEVRVHSSTALPIESYFSDAALPDDNVPATQNALGRGCNIDRQNPLHVMLLHGGAYLHRGGTLTANWYVQDGPFRAPAAAFLLGARNLDLPIPGLCGARLYPDATVTLPPAAPVDNWGRFRTQDVVVPWSVALAGGRLYAQAVASDTNQAPLPLAASNGLETVLPPGLPPVLALKWTSAGNAGASNGLVVLDGGAVVRLDY